MIFDSHAHYNSEAFDQDREEVLASMAPAGVSRIMNVAAEMDSIDQIIELTEKYPYIYGALGIHPSECQPLTNEYLDYIKKEILAHDKIRALGEIGLDYHWPDPTKEVQKKWFDAQLDMAKEVNLPVIIHSRDACKDTMDILSAHKDITGIIHCFSYTKETALQYVDMGYVIGVGGVVTFKNASKLKEAVKALPLDKIVLETDCPYMAPTPYRGERNDSRYISLVIDEIANLKGIDREEVEEICYKTTCKVYNLPE